MISCPKCHSQVAEGTKVCGTCGASLEKAADLSVGSAAPPLAAGTANGAGRGGIAPNVAAMLMYVPLCLVGLVCTILFAFILEPYKHNRFIRFHGWQSLLVHGAFLVLWIGWTILSMALTSMLRIFALITVPVSFLIGLGALALMVILMIKAYNSESYKLPLVGDWAEKNAGQ